MATIKIIGFLVCAAFGIVAWIAMRKIKRANRRRQEKGVDEPGGLRLVFVAVGAWVACFAGLAVIYWATSGNSN